MSAIIRLLMVAVIATVMAVVGMDMIAWTSGNHADSSSLKIVVPLSILLWLILSLLLTAVPPELTGLLASVIGYLIGQGHLSRSESRQP